MSKKQISPFGCRNCVHAWVDRCGLTGHLQQWHVNAKHHCKEFAREKRRPDPVHPVAWQPLAAAPRDISPDHPPAAGNRAVRVPVAGGPNTLHLPRK
jgi:hypothetical protein